MRFGVGENVAATLLVAAGDNANRLKKEPSFAALGGVNRIPASLGKITRHRLNRGGSRSANNAL
ncbi:transposase [Vibrio tubiashii]|uniref:transposase n=1 Tax=Vibrio tubiashii TaxID=29498 RepID=UPI00349EA646